MLQIWSYDDATEEVRSSVSKVNEYAKNSPKGIGKKGGVFGALFSAFFMKNCGKFQLSSDKY